jgi:hypothetical protein
MTAQQKAVDLFNNYYSYLKANLMYDEEARQDAKYCSLIAVDEIIKVIGNNSESHIWIKVKQEIIKL